MKDSAQRLPRWGWLAATAASIVGMWMLYDAWPGLNWGLWTTAVAIGLAGIVHHRHGAAGRPVYLLLVFTVAVAAGVAITTDPRIHALTFALTALLLGCATLLAAAPDLRAVHPLFVLQSPFRAIAATVRYGMRQSSAGANTITSPAARPALRGILITIPCIAVLGLLLSAADPTMAAWRDAIVTFIPYSEAMGRLLVFILLFALTLGAYGFAAFAPEPAQRGTLITGGRLGETELRIVCGSVTAILYLFIALQLSYLFGNAPHIAGTGITYADYARRGFAELVVAAVIVIGLVIAAEHGMSERGTDRLVRPMEYALLVAIVVLLASSLFRIALYESAYGYTVRRLYARADAILLLCTVVFLAIQLIRGFDFGRLSRQVMAVTIVSFIALTWWNKDAWIAQQNVARIVHANSKHTPPLDVSYLMELSDDAIPTLVAALPSLPPAVSDTLTKSLTQSRSRGEAIPWYSWNYRRARADQALQALPKAVNGMPYTPN